MIHCAQILIDLGADVNECSKDGTTPVEAAATNGNQLFCRLLVDAGADVILNSLESLPENPERHFAQRGGHLEVA